MTEKDSIEEYIKENQAGSGKNPKEPSSFCDRLFGRHSFDEKPMFDLLEIPRTPKSNLFLPPSDSPEYTKLNERLKELYAKLELEIEDPVIDKSLEKIVKVKNTACSSLMLRRNKSEKSIRAFNLC